MQPQCLICSPFFIGLPHHTIILLTAFSLYRKQLRYVSIVIKISWKHPSTRLVADLSPVGEPPKCCQVTRRLSALAALCHCHWRHWPHCDCSKCLENMPNYNVNYVVKRVLLRVIKVRPLSRMTWQCPTNWQQTWQLI